mmetsp:Transcript_19601/g.31116  ORF Transcript_19601/g.31116 Transcript_19601/m.31116 type:complete len:239 (-) Transcript_19601:305-1021(-)
MGTTSVTRAPLERAASSASEGIDATILPTNSSFVPETLSPLSLASDTSSAFSRFCNDCADNGDGAAGDSNPAEESSKCASISLSGAIELSTTSAASSLEPAFAASLVGNVSSCKCCFKGSGQLAGLLSPSRARREASGSPSKTPLPAYRRKNFPARRSTHAGGGSTLTLHPLNRSTINGYVAAGNSHPNPSSSTTGFIISGHDEIPALFRSGGMLPSSITSSLFAGNRCDLLLLFDVL